MDAVLTSHATEQSIVPKKQIRIKTPKKKEQGNFISNPSENFDIYAGLLNPPPPPPPSSRAMSFSNSYPFSSASSIVNHQYGQNHQPPLLPLPRVSAIHHQPLLSRSLSSSQGLSLPPPDRKNRTKDMSLTPKKSKPTKKREEVKKRSGTQSISEFLIVASDNSWGPDPKYLPKHLPVVLTSKEYSGKGLSTVSVGNMDMFSGSVTSPPPSSLPLPRFSLRSKLSCNAEAAGNVDARATNNLRRLLRLR
ncbi:uncharacterized protein LOC133315625 [Gastrolobium bilobum]|uniref:uncharacterized protein LOC133315625 n=1 Tax=Gastrolobium bilobum TaxID=150636 RepID=UPI002AB16779|nr:uncharacterized protein LOC133315625 [Gastrolobium bilobum]